MTATIIAKSNGTQAAIQVNGTDALVLDNTGIVSGVKPASITPAMLNGAQTGSAPIFGVRAWCVFNGALTGTNAPVVGGNISSVTRLAVGRYSVTMTLAAPTSDYSVVAMALPSDTNSYSVCMDQAASAPTTTVFTVRAETQSATLTDVSRILIQVVY